MLINIMHFYYIKFKNTKFRINYKNKQLEIDNTSNLNYINKNPLSISKESYLKYIYKYDYFLSDVLDVDNDTLFDNSELNISIDISIPNKIKVYYPVSLIYTFKNCWIQYLSIFIPTIIIVYLIWVFLNRFKVISLKYTGTN